MAKGGFSKEARQARARMARLERSVKRAAYRADLEKEEAAAAKALELAKGKGGLEAVKAFREHNRAAGRLRTLLRRMGKRG